eukprot:COSAG04_NODE_8197_length_1008_cov_1.113311_1_plen_125_part_00
MARDPAPAPLFLSIQPRTHDTPNHSQLRELRPVAPPRIESLTWLEAERRFQVVWRGFPHARAALEPAENLMPSGCAPHPFAYFPSLAEGSSSRFYRTLAKERSVDSDFLALHSEHDLTSREGFR